MGNMGKTKKRIIAIAGVLAVIITGCGRAGREQEGAEILAGVELKSGTEGENGQGAEGNAGAVNPSGTGDSTQAAGTGSGRNQGPVTWQPAYFPLENAYTQVLAAGGTFYGVYERDGETWLDSMDQQTLEAEGIPLPEGVVLDCGMAADREGNLYLPTEEEETGLWKIDASSGEYERIELEDCLRKNCLVLKGIETDAEGYSYVWGNLMIPTMQMIDGTEQEVWYTADRVYVKDRQMKTLYYQDIANLSGVETMCFQIDGEGKPGFLVRDQKEIQLRELSGEGREEKEPVSLGTAFDCFAMEDANLPEHLTYTGGGWLYCRDNRLYEFRYDTGEKVQILDLAAYGILSGDIVFLEKREDRIDIIDRDGEAGTLELTVFTPGATDKETLTLGVTMTASDLEEAVARFNRESAEYRVEITDYSALKGSWEEGNEQLKLDVVTGKAPDMIAVSGIDYRIFSGKGVFADLYELMEGDGECSRDMLVGSVVKAFEEDGHLYTVSPSFQLHSMWGYADVTGGKSGVPFSELLQILRDSGKDLSAVGGFSADEPVLTRLCCAAMDEFVDWEKGTCDFDGEYFREVLSFAGNYHPGQWEGGYLEGIRNRDQVLTVGILSSVADYQLEKEIYGGNLGVIGYPAVKGSGTAVDFRDSAVAVNAGTGNREGAWEFVKFYLLQGYDGQGFPLVQDRFREVMEAAMTEDYTDSENGQRERVPKAYYGGQSGSVAVYAAGREEVDAVWDLVESVQNRFELHPVIQNIIDEEAEGYFSGQVDLDRTVDKIQNRVSLLLQESR